MPELSDRQREKLAQMDPALGAERLVSCLEHGWDIELKCARCGATKTWGRQDMLGRLRPYLNATLAQIQAKAVCPRCPRDHCGPPRLRPITGRYLDKPVPLDPAAARRQHVTLMLLDAGLNPSHYGYGWKPGGM